MHRASLLELGVGLATVLSIGLLGVMLAWPWLPPAASGRFATTPSLAASATPSVAPTAETASPPIGLYLLRGAFSFGPCIALELGREAYPVDPDGTGTATIISWQRGMTGCDTRSDEPVSRNATVTRVLDASGETVVGYAVGFELDRHNVLPPNSPPDATPSTAIEPAEITILANRSTETLLQALETSMPGAPGLVFDRVDAVQPPLDPLPSSSPPAGG